MREELYQAFTAVQADDALKQQTLQSIQKTLYQKPHTRILPKLAVAACCFILAGTGLFGGYQVYMTEVAAISIDVNPSIELSLNRFDRVIGERAFNEEGKQVLDSVPLENKTYQEAIQLLLSDNSTKSYLADEALVSITVEADGAAENKLISAVQQCVGKTLSNYPQPVQAEYGCANETMREEAHSHGLSVGKYKAIQELLDEDPTASLEEFQDQSMQEIKSHRESCQHQSQEPQTQPTSAATDDGSRRSQSGVHHSRRNHHPE